VVVQATTTQKWLALFLQNDRLIADTLLISLPIITGDYLVRKLIVALAITAILPAVAMAAGDAGAGKAKAAMCAGCHGAEGTALAPQYPNLAGQNAQFLENSIKAYKAQERTGGNAAMMYGMVGALADQDIADVAAYYASLPRGKGMVAAGNADAGKGKAAMCAGCHGADGVALAPMYPNLAGQNATYLEGAIAAYKAQQRTGGNSAMMYGMVGGLSDADAADLAAYYAGL